MLEARSTGKDGARSSDVPAGGRDGLEGGPGNGRERERNKDVDQRGKREGKKPNREQQRFLL